ncbi:MAG TPA: hypothetical protein VF395_17615, partial [Polyangiaceae bacterium]
MTFGPDDQLSSPGQPDTCRAPERDGTPQGLHVRAPQGHWLTCFVHDRGRHAEDEIVRETGEMLHDRRRQLTEERHEFQSHPYPQKSTIS